MSVQLGQHQVEIQSNRASWESKPLLRLIYAGFYRKIVGEIDPSLPGQVIEIGSGIGNLKSSYPQALSTDLFPNPWLDLVCDGYELPFRSGSLSHLILFDVFHHLEAPHAFFQEAHRALVPKGRLIIFDPFISWSSFPVYGLLHHEPVAWKDPINPAPSWPAPRHYYAAQGNATRVFFRDEPGPWLHSWIVRRRDALAAFAYLLSGGFSKPAMYPSAVLGIMNRLDTLLSRWPRLFGGRCLVTLEKASLA
ncbi:MAG: class I SAM-dependent methyltransferase [Verrucomicrobia bacterium]|nr:class I SAM-dependent methyltransferase [Verrucomicrobiota bacterium]